MVDLCLRRRRDRYGNYDISLLGLMVLAHEDEGRLDTCFFMKGNAPPRRGSRFALALVPDLEARHCFPIASKRFLFIPGPADSAGLRETRRTVG